MEEEKISFDQMPALMRELKNEVSRLSKLIIDNNGKDDAPVDRWLDLDELVLYDPAKRKKPTFYAYTRKGTIPFHRAQNKKLIFLKSEIDIWLRSGRKQTVAELQEEADDALSNRKSTYSTF